MTAAVLAVVDEDENPHQTHRNGPQSDEQAEGAPGAHPDPARPAESQQRSYGGVVPCPTCGQTVPS